MSTDINDAEICKEWPHLAHVVVELLGTASSNDDDDDDNLDYS